MNAIDIIESKYVKKDMPDFKVGDIVKISLKVVEGAKSRIQIFEGMVIRRTGKGTAANFTVLKQTKGSGDTVEKCFPLYSPSIEKIKVVKSTKVRQSRLYYKRADKL